MTIDAIEAIEATDPALLSIRDLHVEFRLPRRGLGRRPKVRAVSGISLDVAPGETLGLVGESGSGKTTLGRAILGLVRPERGSIRFAGRELVGAPASERRSLGAELQIVFQNPYTSLNPALTIGETLAEPLRVHRRLTGEELTAAVADLLVRVGLEPGSAASHPHAFSGGQRQRIAIARAIAPEPSFIIYDEAVSALDMSTRGQIINLLARLNRDFNLTGLFIGHDLAVVRHISDRIAVMYRGHVVELGPAGTITDTPAHPYTRRLVDAILVPDPRQRRRGHLRRIPRPASAAEPEPTGCPFAPRCPDRMEICDTIMPETRHLGPVEVTCHLYPPREAQAC